MSIKYVTNNHDRLLVCGRDLPTKVRADFDYLSDDDYANHDFIAYRGSIYDVDEFVQYDNDGWDGIHVETFFSGVLIRFVDKDNVIVGRYYTED